MPIKTKRFSHHKRLNNNYSLLILFTYMSQFCYHRCVKLILVAADMQKVAIIPNLDFILAEYSVL